MSENIWQVIASISGEIQNHALDLEHGYNNPKLLKILERHVTAIHPETDEFALVYQEYGTSTPVFIIGDKNTGFKPGHPAIKNIIDNNHCPFFLKTKKECEKHGFPGKESILIVPMKFNEHKNIGAFVLHSKKPSEFEGLIDTLDALNNRLAFYLRANRMAERSLHFRQLHNEMLAKKYSYESDIIKDSVNFLKKWFSNNEQIYIVLVDPFNMEQWFHLAYANDFYPEELKKFRTINCIGHNENNIYGNSAFLRPVKHHPIMLNSRSSLISALEKAGLPADQLSCKSWLAAKMSTTTDSNIGYIILQNFNTEYAYADGDEVFLDQVSDFLALLLLKFRNQKRKESLDKFTLTTLNSIAGKAASHKQLYSQAQEALNSIYGKVRLAVVQIGIKSPDRPIGVVYLDNNNAATHQFYDDLKKSDFLDGVKKHLERCSKQSPNKLTPEKLTIAYQGRRYLAVPMRVVQEAHGGFIIPAEKTGPLTSAYIDELSDRIAIAQEQTIDARRMKLLHDFGIKISRMSGTELTTQDKVIELAHETIKEVMDANNLYIATYDKEKNEISFPFALKNGEVWKEIQGSKRPLDSKNIARTEAIILDKKSIINYTKDEAGRWYGKLGRRNYDAGKDALASWIGVPVFSGDNVIAVIATYHDSKEFIYTHRHLDFLEMLARHVSGMFRILDNSDLKEANQKLEETNLTLEKTIEKNKQLEIENKKLEEAANEDELLADYFLRNIENNISGALLDIEVASTETINDIEKIKKHQGISELSDSILMQRDISDSLKSIQASLSSMRTRKEKGTSKVNIRELLADVIENEEGSLLFSDKSSRGTFPEINIEFRELSIVIISLVRALLESKEENTSITYEATQDETDLNLVFTIDKFNAAELEEKLKIVEHIASKRINATIQKDDTENSSRIHVKVPVSTEYSGKFVLLKGGSFTLQKKLTSIIDTIGGYKVVHSDKIDENASFVFIIDPQEEVTIDNKQQKIVIFTSKKGHYHYLRDAITVLDKEDIINHEVIYQILKAS